MRFIESGNAVRFITASCQHDHRDLRSEANASQQLAAVSPWQHHVQNVEHKFHPSSAGRRGADDYLPKPFNPRELVARMRAVLRRKSGSAPQEILQIGDLRIDCGRRRVVREGDDVPLTGAEFDILLLLVRSAGKVLSREEIAEAALGRPVGFFDRSIDNHMSNLRKQLGSRLGQAERIQNVRGSGYVYTGEIMKWRE
jgi:DNA-binding response OmpR family regulator